MNYLVDCLNKDILYNLCVYLKYYQINILTHVDKRLESLLEDKRLWIWKIKHEFNIDIENSVMPSQMKYMELRSVKDVDYYSDLFIGPEEALLRAYKFNERELMLNFIDVTTSEQQLRALRGAAIVGNTQILNLCRMHPGNPLKASALMIESTIEGAAEGNQWPLVNKNLTYVRSEKYILGKGLARSGNYALMDQYQVPVVPLYLNLAMQNGHLNFALHYFNIATVDKYNMSYSDRENLKELINGSIIGNYCDLVKGLLPIYFPFDENVNDNSIDDLFNFLNIAMHWNTINVIDLLFEYIQRSSISSLRYEQYVSTAIAYGIRYCHLDIVHYVINTHFNTKFVKNSYTVSDKFLEECLLYAPDFVLDYLFSNNYITYGEYKEIYCNLVSHYSDVYRATGVNKKYAFHQNYIERAKRRHLLFVKKYKFLQSSVFLKEIEI